MPSSVAIALFTRDLRVHDNPTLHAATRDAESVVPLFVLDDAILRSAYNRANRARFLIECLHDLDEALQQRGPLWSSGGGTGPQKWRRSSRRPAPRWSTSPVT